MIIKNRWYQGVIAISMVGINSYGVTRKPSPNVSPETTPLVQRANKTVPVVRPIITAADELLKQTTLQWLSLKKKLVTLKQQGKKASHLSAADQEQLQRVITTLKKLAFEPTAPHLDYVHGMAANVLLNQVVTLVPTALTVQDRQKLDLIKPVK